MQIINSKNIVFGLFFILGLNFSFAETNSLSNSSNNIRFSQFTEYNPDENKDSSLEKIYKTIIKKGISDNDINSYGFRNAAQDIYEPNDLSNSASALPEEKILVANLHNINDQDWYKFSITHDFYDKSNKGYTAIVLSRIPFGSEFKFYVVKLNPNRLPDYVEGYDIGLQRKAVYLKLNPGIYYIVVFNPQNKPFNIYSTNYKLFYGKFHRKIEFPFMDSKLKFDFGYSHFNNYYQKQTQILNLRNLVKIPKDGILTKFRITSQGTGGYYNFVKIVNNKYQNFLYSTSLINYSDNYYANNPLTITGAVYKSTNFIWTPQVSFDIGYSLIPDNLHYVLK